MEFIIDNWALIVALFAAVGAGAAAGIRFYSQPTEKQVEKVKEWLLYAVTMAEKELGGGTGKLKLRYAYDLFLSKFNWLAKAISFEQFSGLVDDALEEMKRLIESNASMQQLVNMIEK
jgi:hypothetical protein